jgi:hypothetical protein
VAGMIRQDEGGALDFAQAVEAIDLDAVAEPGERAADVAQEKLDDHGRGEVVLLAKVGCSG